MRRASALVATAALVLALTGCGSDDTTEPKASESTPSQGASQPEDFSQTWDEKESGDQYLAIIEAGNAKLRELQAIGATAAGQEIYTPEQIAWINTVCADLVTVSGERSERLASGRWSDDVRPAINDLVISGGGDVIAYQRCAMAKDTAEITAAIDDLATNDSSSKAAAVREALGLPALPQVKSPNQ